MNDGARYIKIVEWSDEDQCFVGQCPGIIGLCCHGDEEVDVYAQTCRIVDEVVGHAQERGQAIAATNRWSGHRSKNRLAYASVHADLRLRFPQSQFPDMRGSAGLCGL